MLGNLLVQFTNGDQHPLLPFCSKRFTAKSSPDMPTVGDECILHFLLCRWKMLIASGFHDTETSVWTFVSISLAVTGRPTIVFFHVDLSNFR